MTDNEWACKMVEWEWLGNDVVVRPGAQENDYVSMPELAEALRVWFIAQREENPEYRWIYVKMDSLTIAAQWLEHGPEAFIKAVREVCDD